MGDFFQPGMLAAMQNYYIQMGQQSGGAASQAQTTLAGQSATTAMHTAAAALLQAAAAKNAAAMGSAFGLSPSVTSASTILGLANFMAAAKRSNNGGNGTAKGEDLPAPKAVLGSPPPPLSVTPQGGGGGGSHSQLCTPIPIANHHNRPHTVTPSPGGTFRRSPMLSQLVRLIAFSKTQSLHLQASPNGGGIVHQSSSSFAPSPVTANPKLSNRMLTPSRRACSAANVLSVSLTPRSSLGVLQGSEAGTPGPAGPGGETTENDEEEEDNNNQREELAIDGEMDLLDGDGASDDRDDSGGSRVLVVDEELAEPAAKRDPKAKKDR